MMKTGKFILILAIPFLFISCSKKELSENYIIYGQWVEETGLTDKEGLYFDENDTLYYGTRSASRYISLKKYVYSLNDNHTKLYLWPADNPDCQRKTCKIDLKNDKTVLTVTGLNDEFPDQKQKFTRISK